MKLFTAAFLTETNTWSPVPTGMNAFKVDKPFYRRDGSLQPRVGGGNGVLGVWRERGQADQPGEGHLRRRSLGRVAAGLDRGVPAGVEEGAGQGGGDEDRVHAPRYRARPCRRNWLRARGRSTLRGHVAGAVR